jgi:hypothetical protein
MSTESNMETMQGLQKIGGVAALVQAVVLLIIVLGNVAILPSQGVGPDTTDVSKIIGAAPTISVLSLLVASNAIFIVLIALALYERVRAGAAVLATTATIAGIMAAVLFLTVGWFGTGVTQLATLPNQATASIVYVALSSTRLGLLAAARFAVGAWGLLASWAALKTRALPSLLNFLGLLWGVMIMLAFLVPPFGLPVGEMLWNVWLGLILLREPASRAAMGMARA